MSFNTRELDRICKRLRQETVTDDVGIKHRMMLQCKSLLKPGKMNCERCEAEIEVERSASHSLEIQG